MGMNNDLTALLVRDRTTGEVIPFTPTRAGFYKLAKYLANTDTSDLKTAFNHLISRNEIKSVVGRQQFNRIINDMKQFLFHTTDYLYTEYHWFNLTFTNIHDCKDGKYHFDHEMFKFNGYYYPRKWRKYLRQCEDCGEIFFDQQLIVDDDNENILSNIYYRNLGINGHCNDCLGSNYHQCAECGRIFNEYEDSYDVVDGDYVCEDCLYNSGNYCRCDHCGEWFRSDSDDAQFVEDNCYCSWDCCENDGWCWSDRRDCWVSEDDCDNEVDEIVTDYHSHSYEPIGDDLAKATQKHDLYIGRETEVDGLDRYDFTYEYFSNLQSNLLGDTCFLETDGSLDGGFEIISQPMVEKAFFDFNWDKAFSKLVADGWRSHDTETCGTHFHYSKWYLGYTEKQQKDSAKKVCRFFQIFAEDLQKIARRSFQHYCIDLNKFRGGAITSKTDFYQLSNDRYWAVNLQNLERRYDKGTIEIRICRGTLRSETMLASADFFLHIVRNAKKVPWKDIANLKLWFKGIKDKNTIDYIKSRNAFEGSF